MYQLSEILCSHELPPPSYTHMGRVCLHAVKTCFAPNLEALGRSGVVSWVKNRDFGGSKKGPKRTFTGGKIG